MKYELVNFRDEWCIKRIDEDGKEWWIPAVETNSDYEQYLVDTDGGLPIPKESKK